MEMILNTIFAITLITVPIGLAYFLAVTFKACVEAFKGRDWFLLLGKSLIFLALLFFLMILLGDFYNGYRIAQLKEENSKQNQNTLSP